MICNEENNKPLMLYQKKHGNIAKKAKIDSQNAARSANGMKTRGIYLGPRALGELFKFCHVQQVSQIGIITGRPKTM